MKLNAVDVILMTLWLGALIAAIANNWPVGWVAFFGFAAGERWSAAWYR